MPPKVVRRPAAVAGKARARPKGVAKAKVRFKPPGRGGALRRPAAAVVEGGDLDQDEFKEVWKAGREEWLDMGEVEIVGSYWKDVVKVAGSPQGIKIEEGEVYLSLALRGTTSEQVLKWASGQKEKMLRVHLCSKECGGETCEDGLLHAHKFRPVKAGGEEGWMKNLEDIHKEEELSKLKEDARLLVGSSESSGHARQDKKKEKKKKKKREKRSRSTSNKEGEKKKSQKKEGHSKEKRKEKAKKEKKKRSSSSASSQEKGVREGLLRMAFRGTGLDLNVKRRKKLMKKARRLAKGVSKKSKKDDSEKSSSETSSSTSEGAVGEGSLFSEDIPAKRIWSRFPGALTGGSIREMQNHLLTTQGQVWEVDSEKIPPVFSTSGCNWQGGCSLP